MCWFHQFTHTSNLQRIRDLNPRSSPWQGDVHSRLDRCAMLYGWQGSNLRHLHPKCSALPTELHPCLYGYFREKHLNIPRRTKQTITIPSPITNGPQSGASTHHQDHVMMLHSLRVIKMRERIPKKGNPVDAVFWMFAMIVFVICLWTGQESNLWPSAYEAAALTDWATSPYRVLGGLEPSSPDPQSDALPISY